LQEKAGEILLLPFLLASVPKEKVAPKEKDFRPRYAKFAMQLLRLGSGELTLTLKALYFTNPFPCLKTSLHFLYKVRVQTTPLSHLAFAGIAYTLLRYGGFV